MAAAQGIDVNFSTGDFGDSSPVLGFATVQFPASSPFATGIGGTSLALNPDNTIAFQTGWGTNLTRIADTVSLGSPPVVPPLKVLGTGFNPGFFLGFQFGAGGGASGVFPRPSFQSSLPTVNFVECDSKLNEIASLYKILWFDPAFYTCNRHSYLLHRYRRV